MPRLGEKVTELRLMLEKLRNNFDSLSGKKKDLGVLLAQAVELSSGAANVPEAERKSRLAGIISAYTEKEQVEFQGGTEALVKEITERRAKVSAGQERVKAQFDQVKAFLERLKHAVGRIEEANTLAAGIESLLSELAAEAPLREQEAALREALGRLTVELEEKIGHIEEALEVNSET